MDSINTQDKDTNKAFLSIQIPKKQASFIKSSIFNQPVIRSRISQFQSEVKRKTYKTLIRNSKSLHSSKFKTQRNQISQRSYKFCEKRVNYIEMRENFNEMIEQFQKKDSFHSLPISAMFNLKQNIYNHFLNKYLAHKEEQNLDEANLLKNILQKVFNLVEVAIKGLFDSYRVKQKQNLQGEIDIHMRYQAMMEKEIEKNRMKEKQLNQKSQFMKILVQKLRQYKKQIKKLDQNLKIGASKINQFRNCYLEIQTEMINIVMENRNINEEVAKELIHKKMEIALEKKKTFRNLPSKKKLKKQIKHIKNQEKENQKLISQFYEAFQGNMFEGEQGLKKLVGTLIDTILEGQREQPADYSIFQQNLIQSSQKQGFADKSTDMQGFEVEMDSKKCGIDNNQRFINEMVKIKGTQTINFQNTVNVVTYSTGVQSNQKQINCTHYKIQKTVDQSFLFQQAQKTIKQLKSDKILRFNKAQINKGQDQKSIKDFSLNKMVQEKQQIQLEKQSQKSFFEQDISQEEKIEEEKLENSQQEISFEKTRLETIHQQKEIIKKRKVNKNEKKIRKIAGTRQKKGQYLEEAAQFEYIQSQKQQTQLNIRNKKQEKSRKIEKEGQNKKNKKINFSKQYVNFSKQRRKKRQYTLSHSKSIIVEQRVMDNKKMIKKQRKSSHSSTKKQIESNGWKQNKSMGMIKYLENKNNDNKSKDYLKPMEKVEYKENNLNNFISEAQIQNIKQDIAIQIQKMRSGKLKTNLIPHKIYDMCKVISSVIQKIQKQLDEEQRIKNVINYLFCCVKESYGVINFYQLKKTVIIFIRDSYQFQSKDPAFKIFLFLLGVSESGQRIEEHSNLNNIFLLKMIRFLQKKSSKYLKINEVTLDIQNFQSNLRLFLQKMNLESQVCDIIVKYGYSKLLNQNKTQSNTHFMQICLQMCSIMLKKQKMIMESYEPFLQYLTITSNNIPYNFFFFMLEFHFFNPVTYKRLKKQYEDMFNEEEEVGRSELSYFCCRIGIIDFYRLVYKITTSYKLRGDEKIYSIDSGKEINYGSMAYKARQITKTVLYQANDCRNKSGIFQSTVQKSFLFLLRLKQYEQRLEQMFQLFIGQGLAAFNCLTKYDSF